MHMHLCHVLGQRRAIFGAASVCRCMLLFHVLGQRRAVFGAASVRSHRLL
jgi:hypothetical protein